MIKLCTSQRIAFVTGGSGFVGQRLIQTLLKEGWAIRALARSDKTAATLQKPGVSVVGGDLGNPKSIQIAMEGAEVVFHVAALFKMWGRQSEFDHVNVDGMSAIVTAAISTPSVRKIVAVSAAAVVMGDPEAMIDVDESAPLLLRSFAPYSASKAQAERLLLAASNSRNGLETVAIRPPMIWGTGMPMLDQLVQVVEAGQWQWVENGKQIMSTCHVDNLVAALLLAADRGRNGQAYFVADETQRTFKGVISDLLATRQVVPADKSISFKAA